MRKIVYVWNYRDWGGAQVYFLSLAAKTAEHYAVEVVLPQGSESQIVERFRTIGARILFLDGQTDLGRRSGFADKAVQHFRKLKAEHKLFRRLTSTYDPSETALHIDIGFWSSMYLLFRLSRKFHLFYTIHTPLAPETRFRRFLWKLKGKIAGSRGRFHFLASNDAARKSLASFLPVNTFDQVKIAYSGINLEEIDAVVEKDRSRSAVRASLGSNEDEFLVVIVGQFIERKGAASLIDSLPLICKLIPHVRVVWLAMRPAEGSLAERAEAAGRSFPFRLMLGDDVGGRTAVLEVQRSADLFVLPSLEEGLPIALVEAMALGTPCLASNVGAVGEAIEDGVTGSLLMSHRPEELAQKIFKLERDPVFRKLLSANARALTREKFNNDSSSAITVREYSKYFNSTVRQREPLTAK